MRSGYRIQWTERATFDLQNIIDYLLNKWTEKEVRNFARKLDKRLELISINPRLFPKTNKRKNVRRSVLTKHTVIYYETSTDTIKIRDNSKIISIILIILLTVHSIWNILSYYQSKLEMQSPLIPKEIVAKLGQPYLNVASVTIIAVIISFVFFFKSKYKLTIWVCIATLIIQLFI
jgi:plasmid stabilization system protein ParE